MVVLLIIRLLNIVIGLFRMYSQVEATLQKRVDNLISHFMELANSKENKFTHFLKFSPNNNQGRYNFSLGSKNFYFLIETDIGSETISLFTYRIVPTSETSTATKDVRIHDINLFIDNQDQLFINNAPIFYQYSAVRYFDHCLKDGKVI